MASFARRFALLVLAAAMMVLHVAASKEKTGGVAPETVNVRGRDDLELNCPSVAPGFTWPMGTLRCQACQAIGRLIEHRVFDKKMPPEDAFDADEVCTSLMEVSELRQRKNGRRLFYLDGVDDSDIKEETKEPRYVTPAERKALPCAHFLLKQRCFHLFGEFEDEIERCAGPAKKFFMAANPNKKNSKKGNNAEPAGNAGEARDTVRKCFEHAVCTTATRDCKADRKFKKVLEDERIAFMKYEAVYGNDRFKYVPDEDKPDMLVRNPYAAGGEKEKDNELLRRKRVSGDAEPLDEDENEL